MAQHTTQDSARSIASSAIGSVEYRPTLWPIERIVVDGRVRRDLGKLDELAESIAGIGLLHPIVVRPDGRLVAGARRLAACRDVLGLVEVQVTVVDIAAIARGEADENVLRKNFTPSEAVAVADAVAEEERRLAKERQDEGRKAGGQARSATAERDDAGKLKPASWKVSTKQGPAPPPAPKSRDVAAKVAGVSSATLRKARAVLDSGQADLATKMDRSGKVDGAYKELQRRQKAEQEAAARAAAPVSARLKVAPVSSLSSWVEPASVDWIITDPPYPREYLGVYGELAHEAAKVLKPGGSCLVMVGQSYLPDILAAMAAHLQWRWCCAYLTPGGQAVQLWDRSINTFWKPLLWFVNDVPGGQRWAGDVFQSKANDNDKAFHHWGQSESGIGDVIAKLTEPNELVLDPFVGGGTTAVVCADLRRRFIGSDIDPAMVERTAKRLGMEAPNV